MINKSTLDKGVTEVIIFTRFPEAGTTKTRLIALLGSEKAASLQRAMTEKLFAAAEAIPAALGSRLTIYFNGGSKALMTGWLGDHRYQEQQGEDLGDKIENAFREIFKAGAEQAILVGSDIPSIDTQLLSRAVTLVKENEVVIGPTCDGGYYLIGFNKKHAKEMLPAIFHDIAWSSESVFEATLRKISTLQISPVILPQLHDIDVPEDLPFADQWKLL